MQGRGGRAAPPTRRSTPWSVSPSSSGSPPSTAATPRSVVPSAAKARGGERRARSVIPRVREQQRRAGHVQFRESVMSVPLDQRLQATDSPGQERGALGAERHAVQRAQVRREPPPGRARRVDATGGGVGAPPWLLGISFAVAVEACTSSAMCCCEGPPSSSLSGAVRQAVATAASAPGALSVPEVIAARGDRRLTAVDERDAASAGRQAPVSRATGQPQGTVHNPPEAQPGRGRALADHRPDHVRGAAHAPGRC